MLTKKERFEKMGNAGLDTSKYFNINLPEGLAPGSTISVIIDENGKPVIASQYNKDEIYNNIVESGYVKNSRLHRRFVMAQMFAALNYVSYDGKYKGYNDCLKRNYGYDYTLKMMLEEVKVLSKLETRDKETFLEREHFFDRATVAKVIEDYLDELKAYVDKLPTKNCKGVPYKKVKGTNIFVADFDKKLYFPVKRFASQVRCAKDYNKVYNVLKEFMKKGNMVKLPYNTKKSKAWIDAYKGAGAYYTLKNLIMFHDCGIAVTPHNAVVKGIDAVAYLNKMLDAYKGEYYRMFALMKKVIKDNNFDFKKRMEEIYNK